MGGVDYQALYAQVQANPFFLLRSEANDLLSRIAVPCLLYVGERDPRYDEMKEAASRIPDARFVSLPDLNHIQALTRSECILPHVKQFLSSITS